MKVEDLEVYKKLFRLTLQVHELSMDYPYFELFELGSQTRRSSNSAGANLAECFGNKHTNIYLEGISHALGEIRETKHHLKLAYHKQYITKQELMKLIEGYTECSKMLYGLEKSLKNTKNNNQQLITAN